MPRAHITWRTLTNGYFSLAFFTKTCANIMAESSQTQLFPPIGVCNFCLVLHDTPGDLPTTYRDDDGHTPVVFTTGSYRGIENTLLETTYGVYWGNGHPLNTIGKVEVKGEIRGHLMGCLVAIQTALDQKFREVLVYTDSMYTIKCLQVLVHEWRLTGFQTSTGGTIENVDLICKIEALRRKIRVSFQFAPRDLRWCGMDRAVVLSNFALDEEPDRSRSEYHPR